MSDSLAAFDPATRIAFLEQRVQDLLEANNREIDRRRAAEEEAHKLQVQLDAVTRFAIENRVAGDPLPAPPSTGVALNALTKRQADVLAHIAAGYPNKVIASRLGVSEGTVKIHVSAIFKSLGVRTRAQAALALATGSKPAAALPQN